MGAVEDVGVNIERRGDGAGERRAAEAHVHDADALAAIDAEAVEGE
jgi:hypothetical protein